MKLSWKQYEKNQIPRKSSTSYTAFERSAKGIVHSLHLKKKDEKMLYTQREQHLKYIV